MQVASSLSAEVYSQPGVQRGLVLFCPYLFRLSWLLQSSGERYHILADDAKLDLSFKETRATCLQKLENISNTLNLNASKSELLLIKPQRSSLQTDFQLSLDNQVLHPKD